MSPRDPLASLTASIVQIVKRLRVLESNTRAEVSGGVVSVTVAGLPTPGQPGRLIYASNGRKAGEGPGAGTGVLCFDDGSNWETCDTSTPVQA